MNTNRKLFSFLGKPGSGKDTLINNLVEFYKGKYRIDVLSGSNLIYKIDNSSCQWKEIEPIIKRGKNIPQYIVLDLLQKEIKKKRC